MIMGGMISSFAMILASFCNNVIQLYLCIGVLGGKFRERACTNPVELFI